MPKSINCLLAGTKQMMQCIFSRSNKNNLIEAIRGFIEEKLISKKYVMRKKVI